MHLKLNQSTNEYNYVLYTYGNNRFGQIGNESCQCDNTHEPTKIEEFLSNKNISLSAGPRNSIVINDGNIYATGNFRHLGNPEDSDFVLKHITYDEDIIDISSNEDRTIALTDTNKLIVWGSGELEGDKLSNNNIFDVSNTVLENVSIKHVYAYYDYFFVIDDNGKAYGWGTNYNGTLGIDIITYITDPTSLRKGEIPDGVKLVQISGATMFCLGLGDDGKIYGWGTNQTFYPGSDTPFIGLLGIGDEPLNENNIQLSPICISDYEGSKLNGLNIKQISVGEDHVLALDDKGDVYAWGVNDTGQLGDGTTTNISMPIKLDISNIKQISAGGAHSMALNSNGKILTWGNNDFAQLGLGENASTKKVPTELNTLDYDQYDVKYIGAGFYHSMILSTTKDDSNIDTSYT